MLKYFPYPNLRSGQLSVIRAVIDSIINGDRLIVRAPAGFGKTVCVLSGALKAMEETNRKLLWMCRTHREAERVIHELKKIGKKHSWIIGTSIKARSEMCPLPMEDELRKDIDAFSIMCSELRKENKCPYYSKGKRLKIKLPDITSANEIFSLSIKFGVCPYEIAKTRIRDAHIVALNYMYILNPFIFDKMEIRNNQYILVIDEAHNLPEIAVSIMSDKLTASSIEQAFMEAKRYNVETAVNVSRKLMKIIRNTGKEKLLDKEELISIIEDTTGISIRRVADELISEGLNIRRKLAKRGRIPRSYVHRLGKFIKLLELSKNKRYYALILREGEIELSCFEPRILIKHTIMNKFTSVICLSGTIDEKSYRKITGLQPLKKVNIEIDPLPDQILTVVALDVTSDYRMRSNSMYNRMVEYIYVVSEVVDSGIGVFAASYEVLNGLIEAGVTEIRKPLFIEKEHHSAKFIERQIEMFKEKARSRGAIYLGVCGGRASEGEDFPNREMDAVVLAGVPFPEPTLTLKAKIKYYESIFGRKAKLYGYVIPSIWKACQAAGRAIRGPEDRGAIVYLDFRYLKYAEYMPEWLRPRKIIRKPAELKEELCLFFA